MIKRLLVLLLICAANLPGYAAEPTVNCNAFDGLWTGTYTDPSGLFPKAHYPISLLLHSEDPYVYGYTLKTKDEDAGRYGSTAPAFFTARCEKQMLSKVILLRQDQKCGGTGAAMGYLDEDQNLHLTLHWENAMISTEFDAQLQPDSKAYVPITTHLEHARRLKNRTLDTCQ